MEIVLTSDWHIREDTPTCRNDDFTKAQMAKVEEIASLDLPVICAGDLFHHWDPPHELIVETMRRFPKYFYSVAGQHDLPNHNLGLIDKSGIGVLSEAGYVQFIQGGSWGSDRPGEFEVKTTLPSNTRLIGVWHHFTWDGKNLPYPGCEGSKARAILKKFPEFDVIVTGDYHRPFHVEYQGRHLVNPGCLTRQASDYEDHKPRVYIYDAKENSIRIHYLRIRKGVVEREHIAEKEAKENRLQAFISRVDEEWERGISFEDNLEAFLRKNKVNSLVKELLAKSLDKHD